MNSAAGELPKLSVVVPLFNEVGNIVPLVDAIRTALLDQAPWELLLVDDGSTDGTADAVRELTGRDRRIKLIRLGRNYGQATALQAGFDAAMGPIVVSLDGDLQNDPADIPALVHTLKEQDYDLVAGYRVGRRDPTHRRVPSAIANAIVRMLTGVQIRDTGCTLRAYRRELLQGLHLYSDLHRFLPAVAVAVRGARVTEMPVRHLPRFSGESKYGLRRTPRVIIDLIGLRAIHSFRERPLAMFAQGALLAIICGLLSAYPEIFTAGAPDSGSSLILLALPFIWLELAGFLILLGLMAEVALRWHRTARRSTPLLVRRLG
jgi:glycosyltransferase involved in cell wall biosynthesis